MKVKIEKCGINGEGIAYYNQKPIFIPNALPQEEVEIKNFENKGKYAFGYVDKLIKLSPHRIRPKCKYQADCGACPMMIADYDHQIELKRENLIQSLLKYSGRFNFELIQKVVTNPSPFGYRNSIKMPFQKYNFLETGFYKSGTNHFVSIDQCIIHEPLLEKQREAVLKVLNKHKLSEFKAPQLQGLRTLVMRTFDEKTQVTLVSGSDEIAQSVFDEICEIEGIVSAYHSVHSSKKSVELFGKELQLRAGEKFLNFNFADLNLSLLPSAFFQLNPNQARKLFEEVVDQINEKDEVIDVYCGVGTLSLMMAKKAKTVLGIEVNKDAIFAARANAKLNHIENCNFIARDAAEELSKAKLRHKIVVVDPPRSGLDESMIDVLVKNPPKKLIYVSCNPSTLAKNLKFLKKVYTIERIQPFDFFSQTPLLETVVVLNRSR